MLHILYLIVSIPCLILGILSYLNNNYIATSGWAVAFTFSLLAASQQKMINDRIINKKDD